MKWLALILPLVLLALKLQPWYDCSYGAAKLLRKARGKLPRWLRCCDCHVDVIFGRFHDWYCPRHGYPKDLDLRQATKDESV